MVSGMSAYTKTNLRGDVENQAPNFNMPKELEARFGRSALEGETLGLSLMTLAPNFRMPFGHKHEGQEEVYVVIRGEDPRDAEMTPDWWKDQSSASG
jgi:hypothetical protein